MIKSNRKNVFLTFFFVIFSISKVTAEIPERGFTSWMPATRWEEALLAGNGVVGALVFGRPHDETITLNHAKLYLPARDPIQPIDQASHLEEIRQLMLEGKFAEATQIPVKISMKEGYGGQIWSDPFMPAFDIKLTMAPSNIRSYRRSVNYETGETTVHWKDASGIFDRNLFVSRADTVVVMRVKGTGKVNGNVRFAMLPYDWNQRQFVNDNIRETWIEASEIRLGGKDNWLIYRCEFSRKWKSNPEGYEGAGRVVVKGGTSSVEGNRIFFKDADEVLLLVRIEPNYHWDQSQIESMKKELINLPSDYNTLLDRQMDVHGTLYNRVKLDLGGGEDRNLDSETLVLKVQQSVSPAMIERLFDAARYNTLCATGLNPPNLQGIWNGNWTPPWSSDFTHNGNVPVSISSLLCGNLPELMTAYFDYHDRMLPCYRDNARRLYGCRGIHIPSHTSSHGWNVHFDATWCMTFWTAGAGWAANFYYDYYLYTGDETFLRERAYPFMKEAALFYEDFLTIGDDGKYVFNPSYSPENNPKNSESQACINATMDVMIAKQLIRNCIASAKILRTDETQISIWQNMLAKMPAYEVNEDGQLREWLWPGLEDNNDHRHVSQLYGLYDIIDPEIAADPKLIEGAKKVIEERMKIRRRDNGGVMVFGMAQMAFVAANLGDAETVSDLIHWMASRYWSNSLATFHDPGALFNMDLSGGFPAAVIRALVYSEPGLISLLPALPASWPNGKIDGVLLRGQIEMKSLSWDREKIVVKLHSDRNQVVQLKVPGKIKRISIRGRGKIGPDLENADQYRVNLPMNQDVLLKFILE